MSQKLKLTVKQKVRTMTSELSYTTSEINRNFKIKVAGINGQGKKLNTLVGVSGLIKLIGTELADKFVCRAFANTEEDYTVCKLRRGLKITFYLF